jgi:hypothetical protein
MSRSLSIIAARGSAASACSTCRRMSLYAAVLAAFLGCGLLRAQAASAEPLVCSPSTHNVFFSVGEGNSTTFEKTADGCAQPWLSYLERSANIRLWVRYSGGYHDIQSTSCTAGEHTCNLASDWSTACNGATCNGHEFHLQEAAEKEDFAVLHF